MGHGDLAKIPRSLLVEWVVVAGLGLGAYLISSHYDLLEGFASFSRAHESWELDEFVTVALFLMLYFAFFSYRSWRLTRRTLENLRQTHEELVQTHAELEQASRQIKRLQGLVPICARCKRIKDDQGYWHEVEEYLSEFSQAEFSHGLCLDCAKLLYPGLTFNDGKPSASEVKS